MTRAQQWADDLAAWAIPPEILAQAPTSPWIHPVAQFTPPAVIPDSVSHQRAREALPEGGSVLDVGCGGGRASMALAPPAGSIVGVDTQQGMLDVAAAQAAARGVEFTGILGGWLEMADAAPACDVVVCHHVVYNVADIAPFLVALNAHARRRVVIELPVRHPLSNLSPLWQRFWSLERPTGPTADDLVACVQEAGFAPVLEVWEDEEWGKRTPIPFEERVAMARTRLCLPADRDPEVAEALTELGEQGSGRGVATVWWDVE